MVRLAALERVRARAEWITEKLCDLIDGKLSDEERAPFARIADPVLAFTRAATAIRRIVALEEQVDEDAYERAARLADEAAKRARQEVQAARAPADRRIHLRASRRIAHDAMRAAALARDCNMSEFNRNTLLNDLTSDLDLPDYADDMELVLGQIEKELDAILGPPEDDDEAKDADQSPPQSRNPAPDHASQANDVFAALQRASEAISLIRASSDSG
jgi:hypothetical protein